MKIMNRTHSIYHFLIVLLIHWWKFWQPCVAEPSLPFGDINLLVLTDVHSFLAGHSHEVDRNADYGDVLSFYQRIKEYCDEKGADLWLFDNGDFIHGTGLAMDGNATMLIPLLKEMPFDGINMGNHESYYSAVVELMHKDMIPHFGEAFITSNTHWAETMEPFGGSQFQLLKGRNNTILTFGFIYDTPNPSKLLHITPVEEAIEEDWFRVALREQEYDAIVVLAHMDNDDRLVETILHKIREHVDEKMPVQFLTGHSHKRKSRKIQKDHFSRAFEAGGNLDTVGFLSIPTIETANSVNLGLVKEYFKNEFLNSSKTLLAERVGTEELPTSDGIALTEKINGIRKALELDEVVGCPPREYFIERPIHAQDSLFKLWIEHVAPSQIFEQHSDSAMLISADSFRYDIRIAAKNDGVTVDDIVAVVPYMEPIMFVGKVPERVVRRLNSTINTDSLNHRNTWPDFLLSGKFQHSGDPDKPYNLYVHQYDLPEVLHIMDRVYPKHELKPQKTDHIDTLYWLDYAEKAWQCPNHHQQKRITPWFADIKELDREDSDGSRTEDESLDEDIDKELDREENKNDENEYHYEGYDSYLPPSTIEQFGDNLPPAVSPSTVLKPKPPTPAPMKKNAKKRHSAAEKAERMERRKKAKKRAFKAIGVIIAVVFLSFPVCGLYRVFFPDKKVKYDMSDEQFYDMREMRAAKKQRGHRPIQEIQLT